MLLVLLAHGPTQVTGLLAAPLLLANKRFTPPPPLLVISTPASPKRHHGVINIIVPLFLIKLHPIVIPEIYELDYKHAIVNALLISFGACYKPLTHPRHKPVVSLY